MFNHTFKKLICLFICLFTPALFGAAVSISISGNIPKFVAISTNSSSAALDLSSNYDQNTGTLAQNDFTLAQISALSNVRDGYEISASSSNNFQLENTEGVEIDYTLRFDGASSTPSTATLSTAASNGDPLMVTGATTSFSDNTLGNADLLLQNTATNDFVVEDENFSDNITLTITAN